MGSAENHESPRWGKYCNFRAQSAQHQKVGANTTHRDHRLQVMHCWSEGQTGVGLRRQRPSWSLQPQHTAVMESWEGKAVTSTTVVHGSQMQCSTKFTG